MVADPLWKKSIFNTCYYVGVTLPIRLIIALMAAILLDQRVRGITIFRVIFYLPSITAGVAISLLWKLIFQPTYGLANSLLAHFGIQGPAWLGDPKWAMPSIIIMMSLNIGQFMLIFLAGLQSVPTYLYEAVQLDGGNKWHQFKYVTVPFLTPVIFLNIVIGVIEMMQMFTQAYVMTGGGPMDATLVYVMYIYQRAFQWLEMGYASSLAWFLFIVLLTLTIFQFKLSGRWVYYESTGGRK
ncbi:sugar ABC transporter permease, partial [bacterium]|nr:sugar ABC transporter permease [bacterium]